MTAEPLASLDRFIRIDPLIVLPGHGPRFRDVPTLTESMRHHHDSRADEILEDDGRLVRSPDVPHRYAAA